MHKSVFYGDFLLSRPTELLFRGRFGSILSRGGGPIRSIFGPIRSILDYTV